MMIIITNFACEHYNYHYFHYLVFLMINWVKERRKKNKKNIEDDYKRLALVEEINVFLG